MQHCHLALVILATLSGCAGQTRPGAPAAPPAASAPAASAPAVVPTAAAAPVTTPSSAADAEFKPPGGWLTRVKDGKTLYCRTENSVGSRIPVRLCLTQADLKAYLAREKKGVEDMETMRNRTPSMCTAPSCN